jgi:hypothetical protein
MATVGSIANRGTGSAIEVNQLALRESAQGSFAAG